MNSLQSRHTHHNILITGGCGFIGSHLCKKLLDMDENNHIWCIDDLSSGNNIIVNHPRYTFINHNIILSPLPIPDELKQNKISQIYHLASYASPVKYEQEPIKTLETCFIGTQNIIKLTLEHNATLLFTSTSEIYGEPLEHPQKETYFGNVNPNGPRSQYDEGKRVAESLLFTYWRKFGLKFKIVRLFNTYGPNMAKNDGRVISNFITKILNDEPVSIYGDGKQTRSFCYVEDTTDGIIKFMNYNIENDDEDEEKDKETDKLKVVNIGNPDEITINELYSKIVSLMNDDNLSVKSSVNYETARINDPLIRRPDITLANKFWKPTTTLKVGLQKTINYFIKNKT